MSFAKQDINKKTYSSFGSLFFFTITTVITAAMMRKNPMPKTKPKIKPKSVSTGFLWETLELSFMFGFTVDAEGDDVTGVMENGFSIKKNRKKHYHLHNNNDNYNNNCNNISNI